MNLLCTKELTLKSVEGSVIEPFPVSVATVFIKSMPLIYRCSFEIMTPDGSKGLGIIEPNSTKILVDKLPIVLSNASITIPVVHPSSGVTTLVEVTVDDAGQSEVSGD